MDRFLVPTPPLDLFLHVFLILKFRLQLNVGGRVVFTLTLLHT